MMLFVTIFMFYVLCFLFQKHLIYPLENFLFPSYLIDQASILFLPHFVRVISYFIIGFSSLIPIFLAQCFTFILLNNVNILDTIILSFSSTLSLYLGFKLFNVFKENISFKLDKIIDWKKIILIGILASVFNSLMGSIYFFNFTDIYFIWTYSSTIS